MTGQPPPRRTLDEMLRRAQRHAAAAGMTIGIRRFDSTTGEITTVREPVRITGYESIPLPLTLLDLGRFPLCECPQSPGCRERRTGR